MVSLGVREFKEQISQVLQRVRTEGESIEITYYGQVIARLVPVDPKPPSLDQIEAILTDMDSLAAEISRYWPEGETAVAAIEEVRREL